MAYFSRETADIIPYSVGNRIYGGGRSSPNIGPVDRMGYAERDATAAARRNAILRRMQSLQGGKFASADALRTV